MGNTLSLPQSNVLLFWIKQLQAKRGFCVCLRWCNGRMRMQCMSWSYRSLTCTAPNTRGQKLQQWKDQSDSTHLHNITFRQSNWKTHPIILLLKHCLWRGLNMQRSKHTPALRTQYYPACWYWVISVIAVSLNGHKRCEEVINYNVIVVLWVTGLKE